VDVQWSGTARLGRRRTDSRSVASMFASLLRAGSVALALFATAASAPAMEEAEILDLLNQGNDLFKQANEKTSADPDAALDLYAKAVMRYERIVKEGGVENGKLYYNIGNVYFRMKDIGRAILNYRRAQRYIPNDPNLHQNLQYARARRVDSIEEGQKTRVLKTLFFWHYDLSSKARSFIFSSSFILLWVSALGLLFVRRPFLRRLVWLFLVVSVLSGGSLAAEIMHYRTVRPGVIVADEIVARKGDSETYEPSFKEFLHAGTEFILVEKRDDWYHIEIMDGRRCWVPAVSVEMVR